MTVNRKKVTCRKKRKTQKESSLAVRDLESDLDHLIGVIEEREVQALIDCADENGEPKYFSSLENRLRLS
jgi:hypothetical protein